jgi:hypothetical protein
VCNINALVEIVRASGLIQKRRDWQSRTEPESNVTQKHKARSNGGDAASCNRWEGKGKGKGAQVTPTSMHCQSKWRCKRLKRRKQEGEGNRSFKAPMDGYSVARPPPSSIPQKKKHLHLNHPYFSTRHAHSPEWLAAHPRLASSAREGSINEWGAPSAVPTYLVGRRLAAGTSSQG